MISLMPDGAVGRIGVDGQIDDAWTVTGRADAQPSHVMIIAGAAVPSAITFVACTGPATVPVTE